MHVTAWYCTHHVDAAIIIDITNLVINDVDVAISIPNAIYIDIDTNIAVVIAIHRRHWHILKSPAISQCWLHHNLELSSNLLHYTHCQDRPSEKGQ